MKLTNPQLAALKKYADGKPNFPYKDRRIGERLLGMGLIEAKGDFWHVITEFGLGVLDANELPVYGGVYDGRNRMIVAAPTKKAAHAAMQAVMPSIGTLKTWDQWTAETGNDEECRVARAKPLAVFTKADNFRDERFVEKVKP